MGKKFIVNLRGTNASGKSTIPISMMNDKKMHVVGINTKNGKPAPPFLTIFPSYQWVALGLYFTKTGGMDGMKDTESIRIALDYAVENYPEYNIIMEGFLASGIYSTYRDMFLKYDDVRQALVISFLPPIETCFERLYIRNGGKKVSEDNVRAKYHSVERCAEKFKAHPEIISIKIDNSKTKKENMLKNFLRLVEKYEGECE